MKDKIGIKLNLLGIKCFCENEYILYFYAILSIIEGEKMSLSDKKNNYSKKVELLINYYGKYSLDSVDIQKLLESIENFYVVTPLIGGFSSGKSSLINSLLETKLLPVEITPETSIPTEITFSLEENCHKLSNGNWSKISSEDILSNKFNYKDTSLIQAFINRPFLKQIPSVKLVDIPGLDSGIESHNKAIDDYLLNSLAYIITLDAEQGLTDSVILFLKELNLLEVPILVVLTKVDKKTVSDTEAMLKDVEGKVLKFIGAEKFKITKTSARKNDIENVKNFLLEIETQAENIFEKSANQKINSIIDNLERYIKTRINSNDFSIEEIEEKEKLLTSQLNDLEVKLNNEKERMQTDIEKCILVAEAKIREKLEGSTQSFVSDLVAGRDIKPQLNSIIRTSIIESIQSEITPRIQRFFKDVSDFAGINIDISSEINLDPIKGQMNEMMKETIKKSIPLILASIGLAVAGPIGAIVAGIAGMITDIFFTKKNEEEKRQAAESKVRTEIIPQASSHAASSFRESVFGHLDEIREKLHETMSKDKEIKEQALQDLRNQKKKAIGEQERILTELNNDLAELQLLKV